MKTSLRNLWGFNISFSTLALQCWSNQRSLEKKNYCSAVKGSSHQDEGPKSIKAWLHNNAITPNEAQNLDRVTRRWKNPQCFWMFLYCLLSCMIKLYNLRGFLHIPCAFPNFTQYQNDLCLTRLSKRLPISLCVLSGEESVAGNLIMLSSTVDVLVESHVLNWFWSCNINLSKTPRAWFHLIPDGVKTIDVSSWKIVAIVAWRVSVFIMWPWLPWVRMWWVGDSETGFVEVYEVSVLFCFYCATLVFICLHFCFCEANCGQTVR